MQYLNQWLRPRLWRYLARKQPRAAEITLRQSYLFVLPTGFGLSVLLLALLLYVLGTNYQNNLIMLLAYALLVLFVSCILLAFENLHHLVISSAPAEDVFAGTPLLLRLQANRANNVDRANDVDSAAVALTMHWDGQPHQQSAVRRGQAQLPLKTTRRGYYQLPWLKLQSVYPFGLIRCWTYVQLDCGYWVYPSPVSAAVARDSAARDPGSRDEWVGQRAMQAGDSLRQIDWKRFSRQQALTVHQYQASQQPLNEIWLEPDVILPDLEQQLSDLAARALLLHEQQQPFGLRLFGREVPIGQSSGHLKRVLQELALC